MSGNAKKIFFYGLAMLQISGCGGGGDGSDSSISSIGPQNIQTKVIPGNLNGSAILDASKAFFGLSATNLEIGPLPNSSFSTMTSTYSNATADSSGNISVNGKAVGLIRLYPGKSGSQIAVFTCSQNSLGTYSSTSSFQPLLALTPDSTGTTIASATCTTNYDQLQTSCISTANDHAGYPVFSNQCSFDVSVFFSSTSSPDPQVIAEVLAHSSYGGQNQPLGLPTLGEQYTYLGCRASYAPIEYIDQTYNQTWDGQSEIYFCEKNGII